MKKVAGLLRMVLVWVCVGASAFAEPIRAGDTEVLMKERLGEPSGEVAHGRVRFLTYPGGVVTVEDGIVTDFPARFSETATQRREAAAEAAAFAESQRAKGLVFYEGKWLTPEFAAAQKRHKAKMAKRLAHQPRRPTYVEPQPEKKEEPPRPSWQVQKKAPACGVRRACPPPKAQR